MNKLSEGLLLLIGSVYGLISAYYALYFNWMVFMEEGFLVWLFFGEVVATFKGLLWPFFI